MRINEPILKTCQECRIKFYGGGSAKYCIDCKEIVNKRNTKKRYKITKAQKAKDYRIIEKGLWIIVNYH